MYETDGRMQFCRYCGTGLPGEAAYCNSCGEKTRVTDAVSAGKPMSTER